MAKVAKWEISPPPNGLLLIDKEQGITSHDVVAIARKQLKTKKIGHCGTLDPMATGLLMLVIGQATKRQDFLMADQKEYTATVRLGQTTSSQDKESDIEEEKEVPDFSTEQIQETFENFKGKFSQIPPMFSAIKKDGVRLYKLARKGIEVERDPRPVEVFDYEVTRFEAPELDFRVVSSKGFYVRTYAHDIGQHLGCGGHLNVLRRIRSGEFSVDNAMTVDELRDSDRDSVIAKLIPLEQLIKE
ncbi:tRNA pseudouridine(55) synthase TruB [Akkermansiaceae bacterium]|nr:tRNA pseudouridine(55) synthase TruB [Akkermansiaceae bacterium]